MATHLTFTGTTKLWSLTGTGIIDYPSTQNAAASGPFTVAEQTVPYDPVHKTGGAFWALAAGPYAGYLVSAHTNQLGYGAITVTVDGAPATPGGDIAHINPLAAWRLLIKDIGGSTGAGTVAITFNSTTEIWSRTGAGIIKYPSTVNASAGGPYRGNPITVPYDPVHQTGGSFYELKEGPNRGFLVSAHTNTLGYGDITVVSADLDRGPGAVLATMYHPNPHLAGASKLYNKAGELHFTLLVDDANILIPQPKETHYAIEFYNTDTSTWVECFAGLVWDFEASETEVVFYGIDYLALYQFVRDERFDPANPDRAAPTGSAYYKKTITQIVTAELNYAHDALDSPVGFISVGDIAAMTYKVDIYATFDDVLTFVTGLLDSWRAGTAKLTEVRVQKKVDGTYEVTVEDDPGIQRPEFAITYGDLAQGYKVRPFGKTWASRVNMIGRDLKGTNLKFQSVASPALSRYGRITGPVITENSIDDSDLKRRALQAALDASRLGRQVGVGTKLGSFRPFEAYNLLDTIPVAIKHGAVDTGSYNNDEFVDPAATEDPSGNTSGYWAIIGVQWESYDDGHWITTPLLFPKGKGPLTRDTFIQGAMSYPSNGSSYPEFDQPTTPGHQLLCVIVVQGHAGTPDPIPTADYVFHEDPTVGSAVDTTWTILGQASATDVGANIGVSGVTGVLIATRTVGISEVTTTPTRLGLPGDGGVWLWELPTKVTFSLVGTLENYQTASNPGTFTLPAAASDGLAVWGIVQADYGVSPTSESVTGATVLHASSDDNNTAHSQANPWKIPWVVQAVVGSGGGTPALSVTAIGAYTTLKGCGVVILINDLGMALPEIPYSANSFSNAFNENLFDSGVGGGGGFNTGGAPSSGSGIGPPTATTVTTVATNSYTDITNGQQYTYNPSTETWTAVPGTSNIDGGVLVLAFASSTTWVINHNFNTYPPLHLLDASGNLIEGQVVYTDLNTITVTFNTAVAGTAVLT